MQNLPVIIAGSFAMIAGGIDIFLSTKDIVGVPALVVGICLGVGCVCFGGGGLIIIKGAHKPTE